MDQLNLKTIPDDDLLSLFRSVYTETNRRNRLGYKLPIGTYQIGTDIPAGSYRVDLCDFNDDKGFIEIKLFSCEDISKGSPHCRYEYDLSKTCPVIGKVVLAKGDRISVGMWYCSSGYLVLKKFIGLERV